MSLMLGQRCFTLGGEEDAAVSNRDDHSWNKEAYRCYQNRIDDLPISAILQWLERR